MSFASLFAGKMLGDGSINNNHNAPRFCFLHTLADKSYAEYCFSLFSQHIPYGQKCKHVDGVFDKRTEKTYYRVYYQSRTCELIRWLYSIWYNEGHKTIPVEWVADNIYSEGLAIWFQDDGSLKAGGDRIILSTESFTLNEICFLQKLLINKFNINANIDVQNRLDISTRREVRKFQALVEPLIHPCMKRKSISQKWEEWKESWHRHNESQNGTVRSSIYLPYELHNAIRGEGYTEILNNLLNFWLDKRWHGNILNPSKRYEWIFENEKVQKGRFLLTPRFKPHIKGKLDILSQATGFERSELVAIALLENIIR